MLSNKQADYTGYKKGMLTATSFDKRENGHSYWIFKCECGNEISTRIDSTRTNCGCKPYKYKPNHKDLSGKKFGMLTVLQYSHSNTDSINNKLAYWKCQCDCGNIVDAPSTKLLNRNNPSCGCDNTKRREKHGYSRTKLYGVRKGMIDRCYNHNSSRYSDYGGRGISICDEWINKKDGAKNFCEWALNNGYKHGLSIDRINVNGNYEPNNCRWADSKTQANNTTRNHKLAYKGEVHTLAEWQDITGISQFCINSRISNGWKIEDALTIPSGGKRK